MDDGEAMPLVKETHLSAPTETSRHLGGPAVNDPGHPEAELEALRARITATRWPDRELVTDHSQGPKLAVMQELARYWATTRSRSTTTTRYGVPSTTTTGRRCTLPTRRGVSGITISAKASTSSRK
jgi:hypothetical protein